jgi:hypothetical protein
MNVKAQVPAEATDDRRSSALSPDRMVCAF